VLCGFAGVNGGDLTTRANVCRILDAPRSWAPQSASRGYVLVDWGLDMQMNLTTVRDRRRLGTASYCSTTNRIGPPPPTSTLAGYAVRVFSGSSLPPIETDKPLLGLEASHV
jgi:hypothetical protein